MKSPASLSSKVVTKTADNQKIGKGEYKYSRKAEDEGGGGADVGPIDKFRSGPFQPIGTVLRISHVDGQSTYYV